MKRQEVVTRRVLFALFFVVLLVMQAFELRRADSAHERQIDDMTVLVQQINARSATTVAQ